VIGCVADRLGVGGGDRVTRRGVGARHGRAWRWIASGLPPKQEGTPTNNERRIERPYFALCCAFITIIH
jgi:hypothetical protein